MSTTPTPPNDPSRLQRAQQDIEAAAAKYSAWRAASPFLAGFVTGGLVVGLIVWFAMV